MLVKDGNLRRGLFEAVPDRREVAPRSAEFGDMRRPRALRLAAEQAGEQAVAAISTFLEQELNAEFLFEFVGTPSPPAA